MVAREDLNPGDRWDAHYRGFTFHVNSDEEIWWQPYRGTDRLFVEKPSKEILQALYRIKALGGRIHVTETGDVLTRKEEDEGEDVYTSVWLGRWRPEGTLVPRSDPEYAVELRPRGLEPGDLWPSVYDGARYSFAGERAWWHNGQTMKRHPVEDGIPKEIFSALRRFKNAGGSFRVTPWGDVITLVPTFPQGGKLREQFAALPRVVMNIIKLRRERGLEMLPIYIGTIEDTDITVGKPRTLTDPLSEEEMSELEQWAENLGATAPLDPREHAADQPGEEDDWGDDPEPEGPGWDDDPEDWDT